MVEGFFGAAIGFLFASTLWAILWGLTDQNSLSECANRHNVFACEKVFVPKGSTNVEPASR